MKRLLSSLFSVFMLVKFLTGCALDVPRPEVREGRFNISVTYEQDGEVKEASVVYVCEYNGVNWCDINADPYANWKGSRSACKVLRWQWQATHCCRSQPISHSLFGELSTEKYILWRERNEKGIVFYSACRRVVR